MRRILRLSPRLIEIGHLDTLTVDHSAQLGIGHGGSAFIVGERRHTDPGELYDSANLALPINVKEACLYRHFQVLGYMGDRSSETQMMVRRCFRSCSSERLTYRRFAVPHSYLGFKPQYVVHYGTQNLDAHKDFDLHQIMAVGVDASGVEPYVYIGGRDFSSGRPVVVVVQPRNARVVQRCLLPGEGAVTQLAVYGSTLAVVVSFEDQPQIFGQLDLASRHDFVPVGFTDEPEDAQPIYGLTAMAEGFVGQVKDRFSLCTFTGECHSLADVPAGYRLAGSMLDRDDRPHLMFVSTATGLTWYFDPLRPSPRVRASLPIMARSRPLAL